MEQAKKTEVRLMVFFLALVCVVSLLAVQNVLQVRREVDDRTKQYVQDVTLQLARDIDNRLEGIVNALINVGDSVKRYNSQSGELKEFLYRKSQVLGCTSLVITDTQDRLYQTHLELEDVFSLPGIQASLQGENGVSFLKEGILYSIPLKEDGQVIGTLSALRSLENMQALIQPVSFSGQGMTCIVDQEGEVIVSPTELAPFLNLDSIFQAKPDSQVSQDIYQMEKDMQEGESGMFRFTAVDSSDLLLAYNPMHSYNWILLTLVPSNVVSQEIDKSMNYTFVLTIGVVAVMTAVVFFLLLSWRYHYKRMEKVAFVDPLTGAMNNAAFQLKCSELVAGAPAGTYAVALLNIKQFKLVNERFTSEGGNRVLQQVMELLQKSVSSEGLAARADADNFYLCLKESDPEKIRATVTQIVQDAAAIPVIEEEGEMPYYLVLQPGVYVVDDPALDITIIQDRARVACRSRSVEEDRVCKFFDESILARWKKEKELNDLFAASLQNRDFQVWLQPKVWTADGKISGAEALVRWNHPQKGIISPGDFIPLFEANGRIRQLDLYVFSQVCRTLRRWLDEGRPVFPISVNLSRRHIPHQDFLDPFAGIAGQYRIPPELLELELTESVFFDDQSVQVTKARIRDIHALGFQVSLDDFGSGFSSLGMLMEFDVDAIKLDRRFFSDMENPKLEGLMASIVELGHKLDVRIVAEGIETRQQVDLLRRVDCDMIQGYFYSRPLPIAEFEAWLNERGEWEAEKPENKN